VYRSFSISSNARCSLTKKQHNGFLLLELLVALALLSGLLVLVAQYQAMSYAGQAHAVKHTQALSQARVVMEQLLAGEQPDQNSQTADEITLAWHVTQPEKPTGSFDSLPQKMPKGFVFVHVDAQWQDRKEYSFTLVSARLQQEDVDDD